MYQSNKTNYMEHWYSSLLTSALGILCRKTWNEQQRLKKHCGVCQLNPEDPARYYICFYPSALFFASFFLPTVHLLHEFHELSVTLAFANEIYGPFSN